ncbi:MAG: filamentous hemagglutinin N-terminal domain-containing protein [Denitromonas halophila]|nr:MAG: filamentous hemagglutinin N-terminal domain-containing protein [Denitromonas halophila]
MPYAKSAPLSLMALLRAIRRPIASAVLVTFTLSPYGALAGTTPDSGAAPQNQASVTNAGSVPVVNIVTPDAGGLSHNKWQQFDVPTQGMVLNNATAATHTTLVGTLGANPNLASGAAQVILNEVTSNQPSSLLGTLELAGQSARVIIANPNGITCNGCGFINTPHVQLTTGRPGFDNGALRFDVTGGQIDIGASGLSVLATRLDLIAHTLRTEGAISTQADLNLIAGRFYANSETLTLTDAGRSGVGPFPFPAASYAIDIGQSVSADSIQIITSRDQIGVRTAALVAAFTDLTIASRKTLALGGAITAGRDIGIYNTGAWGSEITGPLTAQRDLQIIAMDLSVAAGGSLRTTAGNIELGFIGDNSDAHTQFINHGMIAAAGDLSFGNVLTGLNTGALSAGGTIDAALSALSPKTAAASLPGAFGETFYAQFGAGPGAQLANTGAIAAGQDLYFNLIENDGGSLSAGRDAFVWQAQRGQFAGAYQTPQHRAGSVSTTRDLFVFAPGDRNEFTSPGTQSFNAAGNLYLLPEADRFNPPSDLRTTLLADLSAPSPSGTARYINRDIFDATGDLSITLPAGFENQKTLHGRDIRISATEVINTAQIDTQHEVVRYQGTPICDGSNAGNCVPIMFAPDSPEPYPGCKTNYTGTCTTDTEVVASTALIEADRDLIIDSPVFSNVGATTLAGGNIDIATNDFFNGQRDYQATWSAEYSAKPFQQAFSGTSCTTCEASIDWSRTAAGTVPLGSIAGNIQAGNVFSVDTLPRSGQPVIVGNTGNSTTPNSGTSNTSPPPTNTPSVTATLAQAITQGAGSVDAAPPALSKFINTGNINAAAIVVKADDIRNGFDTVKDYYQRTGAPQLPPSTITVANYGTAGTTGASTYSGVALMQVLPPALASSAPFALTPAEEQAALRNAFLATTGRAWILPGLTWDPTTGQSPAEQQHAILAANGAAFAIEHGIPVGSALSPAQQAQLAAPALWYVNQGGSLTPTVYLPASWQQQLINLPGGKLDGDVAIALTARHVDNTGFVLTDGQLSIDAEALENQKRNAYYYEKRDVKGGTLTLRGDTVQPGGFMQAAQWELNADKVYSRSGEFIVTGTDAAQTAARTAAFEAEIRAILGNNFTYETAQDNLKTEFKKDRRGWNLATWIKDTTVAQFAPTDRNIMKAIAAQPGQNYVDEQVQNSPALYAIGKTIVTMVASFFGGPYAGAGAAASWDQYYTYDATGDINASRRVGAKSFAVSMVSQYVGGQIDGAVANNTISATTGTALNIASQAAIQSAVSGTSFKDALINAMINEGSALGAGYIGDNNFGPPGSVGHKLAHGVLGAMVESARGGDPLAGALGAMTATLVDQPLDEALGLNGNARQMALQAVSMIAGSLVASAAGRDALAGGYAALNTTANNYLKHDELAAYERELRECAARQCAEADLTVITKRYEALSAQHNAELAACTTHACVAAHLAEIDRAAQMQDRVLEMAANLGAPTNALAAMQRTGSAVQAAGLKILRAEQTATELAQWQQGNCQGLDSAACAQKLEQHKEFVAGIVLDFTPIIGDIKGFAEANSLGDYTLAVLGTVAGPLGDAFKVAKRGLSGAVADANFAQSTIRASETFSADGVAKYSGLAGRPINTVDDLATAIRNGAIKPSQIPVDYVVTGDGTKLILNTRTSVALDRAGIPKSEWHGTNQTGVLVPKMDGKTFDQLAQDQLKNNKLPPTGTPDMPTTKGKL